MGTLSPKPFKTYDEQIEILKSRCLHFDNELDARKFLEINNYYNVINGYKDPFLIKGSDQFLPDMKFEYIKALYLFDKSLRHSILSVLLDIETTLKAVISYEFAKLYCEIDYLNPQNYKNDTELQKRNTSTFTAHIKDLESSWLISSNISYQNIKHYKQQHHCLPVWVLCTHLNMSDISKFYANLKEDAQQKICNHLVSIYGKPFNPEFLYIGLWILSDIRNLCAHNQRLYNFTTEKHFKSRNNQFIKKLESEYGKDFNHQNIVSLAIIFYHLSTKKDISTCFTGFLDEIQALLNLPSNFTVALSQKNKPIYDFIKIMLSITKTEG